MIVTGSDGQSDRLRRSFPCRKDDGPLLQVICHRRLRCVIQGHRYLHALVGIPPNLYRVIALENDSITIILRHLKNRVVRIGVLCVLRLESSNFFHIVFLKDQFAINHGKGSRRKAGLVVEVGVFRHRVVGILHTDGGEYLPGTDQHCITNDHRLGGVPLPVSSADAEMVKLVTRGGSCGFHEFPRFPIILGHALITNH